MSGTAKGLNRQQMADRIAFEFQDGWIVNLGVGIPTMCSNTDIGDRDITYHSENGVIGYGPIAPAGEEDLNLVNAGGQNVTLKPGAAVVHHADLFGIIRGGHIDVTVMGAYEVACSGDFANWKIAGQKGGGIGGAMDLAACAKRVFIIMEQTTRSGAPRLVAQCALPVTARGVVKLVATNYGLVRADRRRVPHSRDRTWRHAGRGARDGRLQADGAGESADGAGGRIAARSQGRKGFTRRSRRGTTESHREGKSGASRASLQICFSVALRATSCALRVKPSYPARDSVSRNRRRPRGRTSACGAIALISACSSARRSWMVAITGPMATPISTSTASASCRLASMVSGTASVAPIA